MARRRVGVSEGIRKDEAVLVVGLGRFGSAVAQSLVELGHEVLGVDASSRIVQRHSGLLTHVAEADTTDPEALAQLGAKEFQLAIVGIGTDIEASILTTSILVDFGVPRIWAKAITERHGTILERVGAHHVVFPEQDEGKRVAHTVTGHMLEYIEVDTGFALVETRAPADIVGQSLAEARLRERYNVTVVCVKPEGAGFTYATPETVVGRGDLLLVAGETDEVERFSEST